MIWSGTIISPGLISSLKLPTALNATIALTPKNFKAAMFARAGTFEGGMLWWGPWRERKATDTVALPSSVGRVAIVIGDEGEPQGWRKEGLTKKLRKEKQFTSDSQWLQRWYAQLWGYQACIILILRWHLITCSSLSQLQGSRKSEGKNESNLTDQRRVVHEFSVRHDWILDNSSKYYWRMRERGARKVEKGKGRGRRTLSLGSLCTL